MSSLKNMDNVYVQSCGSEIVIWVNFQAVDSDMILYNSKWNMQVFIFCWIVNYSLFTVYIKATLLANAGIQPPTHIPSSDITKHRKVLTIQFVRTLKCCQVRCLDVSLEYITAPKV